MAANFSFVPRSVRHKSHKPKDLSKVNERNLQKACTGSCASNVVSPGFAFNDSKVTDNRIIKLSEFSAATEGSITERTSGISAQTDEGQTLVEGPSDDEIVYFSKNQRWPEEDEPVCVVCGRYGEYICDETEADVCSKECKARNLLLRRTTAIKGIRHEPSLASCDDKSMKVKQDGDVALTACFQEPGLSAKSHTYSMHPAVASLSETQVNELRTRMEINIKGESKVRPILEFHHCGWNDHLLRNLEKSGYRTPTPVQMQVIPLALSGYDLLACAQTGSGKTAAFLLPMIAKAHFNMEENCSEKVVCSPQGLVLVPTRELCMQMESQAKDLMCGLPNMRTALVVGGMPMPNQVYRLKQGVQIVFATPGRMAEIIKRTEVDLSRVEMLVLDEVDVLMQMGFENQVQSILESLPEQRQTLLFSATIPPSVERISSNFLTNPVWVSVGPPSAPNMDVKQVVLWVEDKSKKKRLFAMLQDDKYFMPPILVFVDSRMGAELLSEAIQKTCNVHCTSMHGEKVQSERTKIWEEFLAGEIDVLVCTGVMGRGLDLRCVRQVINFDMPSSVHEYIHQVGRAGRLGSKGLAITFINNTNKGVFLDLMETVEPHGVKLPEELLHSPHVVTQQYERSRMRKDRKRKYEETYVNRENLMDILKKSTFRRRLKNR